MVGNPPWELTQLNEKEFFSDKNPAIANAQTGAKRKAMIEKLSKEDPHLWNEFVTAIRFHDGLSHFLSGSGLYPLCGRGRINLYAVFAEATRQRLSPVGVMGLVLPSGIATDDTTKLYFQDVISRSSLISLFDFENRLGLFPAVDSRMKFCLFTAAGTTATTRRATRTAAAFVFFAHSVENLDDPDRRFTLSAEDIELLNPNTRTCPIFRSRRDSELTKAIYRRVPVFVRKDKSNGNPWGIRFKQGLFNMTSDSHLFHTRQELVSKRWRLNGNVFEPENPTTKNEPGVELFLPLYEAKMVDFFDHRAADVILSATAVIRQGQPESLTDAHHRDSTRLPIPRSWVSADHVRESLNNGWSRDWFLAIRDITSPTNERTVIPSLLPATGVGNNLPLLFMDDRWAEFSGCLLANLGSFCLDYTARFKVGGLHLNFFIVEQFPVLAPETYSERCRWSGYGVTVRDWLRPYMLELTYTAWDLQPFARDCAFDGPPFRWDQERRFQLRCELDAAFFHLYLGSDEEWHRQPESVTKYFSAPRDAVAYIMDTFPIVKRKDEEKFGTYRTKDTILKIYDDLAESQGTGRPYVSPLNPPPGPPTDEHGHFIPMFQWDPNRWPSHIHPPREDQVGG